MTILVETYSEKLLKWISFIKFYRNISDACEDVKLNDAKWKVDIILWVQMNIHQILIQFRESFSFHMQWLLILQSSRLGHCEVLQQDTNISKEHAASIFRVKVSRVRGSMLLWNVSEVLSDYMALHPQKIVLSKWQFLCTVCCIPLWHTNICSKHKTVAHLLQVYSWSVRYTAWCFDSDWWTAVTVTLPGEGCHLHWILGVWLQPSYIQLLRTPVKNIKPHWVVEKTLSLQTQTSMLLLLLLQSSSSSCTLQLKPCFRECKSAFST